MWLKSLASRPHITHLFGKLLFILASSAFIRACFLLTFFIIKNSPTFASEGAKQNQNSKTRLNTLKS